MASSIIQKLQLKPGQQIVLMNAPAEYAEKLPGELEGISIAGQGTEAAVAEAAAGADAVLVFVNSLEETGHLVPEGIRAVQRDGLLWVAYPKGTSKVKTDVNRDKLWVAVEPTGWRPVRQVALDEVWSVMRFRPADLVGK